MAAHDRTLIQTKPRTERGSRANRRLRREGLVPGVLYGHGREPVTFTVNEFELRAVLKQGHALMDVTVDEGIVPVIVKATQHHPVRGGFTHIDLLEVDLKQTIQSYVHIELIGAEDAPGVVQGGILDHVLREMHVEALPTEIPDSVQIDVSAMELNETMLLDISKMPSQLTILHDPAETVVATITPPSKVEVATDEVEEETEVVGEAAAEAEESSDGEGS